MGQIAQFEGLLQNYGACNLFVIAKEAITKGQASSYLRAKAIPARDLPKLFNIYHRKMFHQACIQTVCRVSEEGKFPDKECISDPVHIRANLKTMIEAAAALCVFARDMRNNLDINLDLLESNPKEESDARRFFETNTQGELHPTILTWLDFSMTEAEVPLRGQIIVAIQQMFDIPEEVVLRAQAEDLVESRKPKLQQQPGKEGEEKKAAQSLAWQQQQQAQQFQGTSSPIVVASPPVNPPSKIEAGGASPTP